MTATDFLLIVTYVLLSTIIIMIASYFSNSGRLPQLVKEGAILLLPCGFLLLIGALMNMSTPGIVVVALIELGIGVWIIRSTRSSVTPSTPRSSDERG